MATKLQQQLFRSWAEGTDFILDLRASPKREFARIAKMHGWVGGDKIWNGNWRTCFGDEYGYIAGQSRKPDASTPFFAQYPKFAMDSSAPVTQEFFRLCHFRAIKVGSKVWRRSWNACFCRPWSKDEFGGYRGTGPASKLQQLCFGVYANFRLEKNADVCGQFTRLQMQNSWSKNKLQREKTWCFGDMEITLRKEQIRTFLGTEINVSGNANQNADGDSDSGSGSECTIYTPSISDDGGVSLNNYPIPTVHPLTVRAPAVRVSPDPTTSLTSAFHNLAIHPIVVESKSKVQRRAEALETDFTLHFGSDLSKLEGWQKLCNIVGLPQNLKSVTQCKKALKNIYINLVNLVQHIRNPAATPLIKFSSLKEFRMYTMGSKSKRFPKAAAKQNAFLKALLRRIY